MNKQPELLWTASRSGGMCSTAVVTISFIWPFMPDQLRTGRLRRERSFPDRFQLAGGERVLSRFAVRRVGGIVERDDHAAGRRASQSCRRESRRHWRRSMASSVVAELAGRDIER